MADLIGQSASLARQLGFPGAAALLGLLAHWLVFYGLRRLIRAGDRPLIASTLSFSKGPLRLIIPLLAAYFALPLARPGPDLAVFFRNLFSLCLIASLAWLIVRLLSVPERMILARLEIDVADNLRARRVATQVAIIKRVAVAVVSVIAFASMLMVFDKVRQLGTSILASAGIVGIVVGFAAQRSLATLLAGLQLAITQPIRLDDVVIVENEWGRIEEITMTYVVVRIWDQRRLILPTSYFIERPFQNWTRSSAEILGTVFLYLDYTVPIEPIRARLAALLQESPLFDGRAWSLQVTNATERAVELRALMSAKDASDAWNLRCQVREKLIEFIQERFPDGLPRIRAEVEESGRAGTGRAEGSASAADTEPGSPGSR